MASIEQRTNTWRVIWNQDRKRQTEPFTSEEDAHWFKGLVEAAGNRWPYGWIPRKGFVDPATTSSAPTFREWAEKAIDRRTHANDRTKADYRRDLTKHVYPYLGDMPIDQIASDNADALVERLVAVPLAPKTIANLHGLVSSLMTDALQHRPPLVDHNPFESRLGELPTVKTEDMVFLTPSEFESVDAHIGEWWQPVAETLYGTGMRFGELTALAVAQVDLLSRRKTLTVVRAWKRQPDSNYLLGEPKTKRGRRTISLSPKLVDVILPMVAGKRGHELVFPARYGGQMLNSTFRDIAWAPAVAWSRVCPTHAAEQVEAAGKPLRRRSLPTPCDCPGVLDKLPRIHDLRHSHVAQLIAEGVPLAAISRRLGHESIQTTMDRYGHLVPDLDDQINAAVDHSLMPWNRQSEVAAAL